MSSRSSDRKTSTSSSSSKSKSSTLSSSSNTANTTANYVYVPSGAFKGSSDASFDSAPQNAKYILEQYEKGQKMEDRKVQSLKPTRGSREDSPVSIFQLDDIDGHPDPTERDDPQNQLVFKTTRSPQQPSWLSSSDRSRSDTSSGGGGMSGSSGGSGSGSGRKK